MTTQYSEAQKEVMLASFQFGQAQRALEDAEERLRKALENLDSLEGKEWPSIPNPERIWLVEDKREIQKQIAALRDVE